MNDVNGLARIAMAAVCAQTATLYRSIGLYEQANLLAEKAYQVAVGSGWCPYEHGRGITWSAIEEREGYLYG